MKESEAHTYWCPMAHVSVQRVKAGGGGLDVVGPAWNRTTLAPWPQDQYAQHACCIGTDCAWWRPSPWNILRWFPILGLFFARRGQCGGSHLT